MADNKNAGNGCSGKLNGNSRSGKLNGNCRPVDRQSLALQYTDHLRREFGLRADRVIFINGEEIVVTIRQEMLVQVCSYIRSAFQGILTTMVGTDERALNGHFALYYTFSLDREGIFITVKAVVEGEHPVFPSVTPDTPAAHWYEREVKDMLGLVPVGHPDPRRLVLHDNWPQGLHPLRKDFKRDEQPPVNTEKHFPFPKVEGEGVFEIPVGPIHAGIIEPGHFRFSAMGESVLHLEARLFYTHRGVEKLAEGMSLEKGLFLAERVCATCAVSHAVAYCQAVEKMAGVEAPPRVRYIRTILLELERIYNHIGDVGNICAGTGFAFGTSHCGRIKEMLMQLNEELTGNRFLRGMNRLGGVRRDIGGPAVYKILNVLEKAEREFREVTEVILSHDFFLNRAATTGILPRDAAVDLGAVGPAARASGVDRDIRREHPHAAYGDLEFEVPVFSAGDVLCRLQARVEETFQSIKIIRQALEKLPCGDLTVEVGQIPPYRHALGYSESARGENIHWLMTGPDNTIFRYRVRSASFCNWPVVPLTVPGNIVPDFPLINKSFELCYSCLDR